VREAWLKLYSRRNGVVANFRAPFRFRAGRKKTAKQGNQYTPAMRRKTAQAIYDFHVRAFGEEMARVNHLPVPPAPLHRRKWLIHATRKGVKFDKPALGVTRSYIYQAPGIASSKSPAFCFCKVPHGLSLGPPVARPQNSRDDFTHNCNPKWSVRPPGRRPASPHS